MGAFDDLLPKAGTGVPNLGSFDDLVPNSLSPEAARKTANDVGAGEAVLLGAGRSADKVISGVQQLALEGGRASSRLAKDPEKSARLRNEFNTRLINLRNSQADADTAYAPVQADHPFASSFGEALPFAAVPASAGPLAAGMTVGAVEALKYGEPEDRAQRGVVGLLSGTAGQMLGRGAGGILAPGARTPINETKRDAIDRLVDMGGRPRLSQVTGSKFAGQVEDWAAQTPGGVGRMAEHEARNATALNRAAAGSIGQNADELSSRVFADANRAIGSVFNELRNVGRGQAQRPIAIDAGVAQAADNVLATQARIAPEFRSADVASLATRARALALNHGRIDAETYQLARSSLTDAAQTAFQGGNSQVGRAYQQLLESLDAAADRSLTALGRGDLVDALQTARQQWANLKMLEKGRTAAGGDVNAAALVSTLRSQNPMAFREGRGNNPLSDIGMIGENLKPLATGSQTHPRQTLSSPIQSALVAPAANAAARITTSPMLTGYAGMLGRNPTMAGTVRTLIEDATRAGTLPILGRIFGPPLGVAAPVVAEQ